MGNHFNNVEEYNPNKERKILIAFDNIIADMNYSFEKYNSLDINFKDFMNLSKTVHSNHIVV